ncbi:MAG: hypothetical protein CMP10_19230 [Zetaproteobacteria bacterium]|nr:hypothetical protein [Pseudobdellovibrionaceae bacterium]|tara:strand:+ start:570 stop:752 length:183 start_codon:yes stop_codon:yes gene_type:complete
MFGWFSGDKTEKLRKKYLKIYQKAIEYQRNGNIRKYSELIDEAEPLRKEIEALEQEKAKP